MSLSSTRAGGSPRKGDSRSSGGHQAKPSRSNTTALSPHRGADQEPLRNPGPRRLYEGGSVPGFGQTTSPPASLRASVQRRRSPNASASARTPGRPRTDRSRLPDPRLPRRSKARTLVPAAADVSGHRSADPLRDGPAQPAAPAASAPPSPRTVEEPTGASPVSWGRYPVTDRRAPPRAACRTRRLSTPKVSAISIMRDVRSPSCCARPISSGGRPLKVGSSGASRSPRALGDAPRHPARYLQISDRPSEGDRRSRPVKPG